jgi:hypothetical protein
MTRQPAAHARRSAWAWALSAGALLSASCGGPGGPKAYPVQGRVFHKGQPAAGARVVFHPKSTVDPQAPRPYGTVRPDGSFNLTTYKPDDGAPAGDYHVTVIWPNASGRKKSGGAVPDLANNDRLKGEYSSPARSPFQARVVEGKNELEAFDLR